MKIRKDNSIIFTITLIALMLPNYASSQEECHMGLPEMPIEHLQERQKMYYYTVTDGDKVVRIELRYEGVTSHPIISSEKMILASTESVVSGQSGSNVCADNMFVGAIAYRYGFIPKDDELGGITPARAIKNQKDSYGQSTIQPSLRARSDATFISTRLTPNILIDFSEDAIRETMLKNVDILSVGTRQTQPENLYDGQFGGQSATMLLARGAIQIGGTCTITGEFKPDTLTMCGHPFYGDGRIEAPVYRSTIAHSQLDELGSFKIVDRVHELVGTAFFDGPFGVEIAREEKLNIMLPINLGISLNDVLYEFPYEVIRHNLFTAPLISIGYERLIGLVFPGMTESATSVIKSTIYFSSGDSLTVYDSGLIESLNGRNPWRDAFKNFTSALQEIFDSRFASEISRIDFEVSIVPAGKLLIAHDVSILVNDTASNQVNYGDTVTVSMVLQDNSGFLNTQTIARSYTFIVPDSLDLLYKNDSPNFSAPIEIFITSGNYFEEKDEMVIRSVKQGTDVRSLIEYLSLNIRDPYEMFIQVIYPSENITDSECTQDRIPNPSSVWQNVARPDSLVDCRTSTNRITTESLGIPTEFISSSEMIVDILFRTRITLMLNN